MTSSTSITIMFTDYDAFWTWFFILHAVCTALYGMIFWWMFKSAEQKGEQPKDCLLLATCTISTIHSHISCIGVVIGFFVDGLYKPENYMISPPGVIAVVWMLWSSYMLTDLVGHVVCFYIKPIPYRLDVICHHTFAYTTLYLLDYPTPIYGWLILCAPLVTEFSTIFMNFRWFAKHYHYSRAIQHRLNTVFVVTWYTVRLPAILALLVYLILFWHEIYANTPRRVAVCGTVLIISINLLHVVWGYLFTQKVIKTNKKGNAQMALNENLTTHIDSSDTTQQVRMDDTAGSETDSLLKV